MASRGRSVKGYAKGAERREEILQAAFGVLSRDGYAKTSLGQIGRSMGIESAHVLYYFSSREALMQEVLERWDAVRAEVRGDPDQPFSWWAESMRHNEADRGIVQLYLSFAMEAAAPDHPAHVFFTQRFTRIQRDAAAEVAALQAAGRVDPVADPREVADLLIAVSDGLTVRWLVDPSLDMAGEFAAAVDRLLRPAPSTNI